MSLGTTKEQLQCLNQQLQSKSLMLEKQNNEFELLREEKRQMQGIILSECFSQRKP